MELKLEARSDSSKKDQVNGLIKVRLYISDQVVCYPLYLSCTQEADFFCSCKDFFLLISNLSFRLQERRPKAMAERQKNRFFYEYFIDQVCERIQHDSIVYSVLLSRFPPHSFYLFDAGEKVCSCVPFLFSWNCLVPQLPESN